MHVLAQNLKGFEVFTLEYKVKWPLNLVISRKSLTKYQILFRHMFYCKYVERLLCNMWLYHQQSKQYKLQKTFWSSYFLTQKMIHFQQNLLFYICYEVIEQKWQKFMQNTKSIQKFEELIQLHDQFLDECLQGTLLLDTGLYKSISRTSEICRIYSQLMQSMLSQLLGSTTKVDKEQLTMLDGLNFLEQRKQRILENEKQMSNMITQTTYDRFITNFQTKFETNLKELMQQIESKV